MFPVRCNPWSPELSLNINVILSYSKMTLGEIEKGELGESITGRGPCYFHLLSFQQLFVKCMTFAWSNIEGKFLIKVFFFFLFVANLSELMHKKRIKNGCPLFFPSSSHPFFSHSVRGKPTKAQNEHLQSLLEFLFHGSRTITDFPLLIIVSTPVMYFEMES